ncbi:DUF4136 domain-containing protein [Thalassotalea insulae]|uniref:DUF4136 domain-containing protein n=1 Tax=Thalassotalea insulae TaxID=2056778 RepID=UPI0024E1639E|nr:DUF4136 domain-containing protein [Thalassotalea insulae]
MLLLPAVTSCSGRLPASAKYSRYYDFSAIKSYSTFDRNSAFSEYQNISDATRNSIELAIEQALDSLGYSYQSSEQADILISYHLINKSKELKKYNRGVSFCRPCLTLSDRDNRQKTWRMQPGSLILDVVSRDSHRSVWRSVYPLDIKEQDNSFEVQEKIQTVIKHMLTSFPLHASPS